MFKSARIDRVFLYIAWKLRKRSNTKRVTCSSDLQFIYKKCRIGLSSSLKSREGYFRPKNTISNDTLEVYTRTLALVRFPIKFQDCFFFRWTLVLLFKRNITPQLNPYLLCIFTWLFHQCFLDLTVWKKKIILQYNSVHL